MILTESDPNADGVTYSIHSEHAGFVFSWPTRPWTAS